MKHKHIEGLTIELVHETKKGYMVKQTELFASWSDKKLRTPKVKMAYYTSAEIKDLFE